MLFSGIFGTSSEFCSILSITEESDTRSPLDIIVKERLQIINNVAITAVAFVKKSPAVPFEYWYKVVEHLEKKSDIDKFFIVTDDYKYSKILFPNFEILKGSMEDDYFSILNAI